MRTRSWGSALGIVAVATVLTGATMSTRPAEARWGGCWGCGAFAVGAIAGAAMASAAYVPPRYYYPPPAAYPPPPYPYYNRPCPYYGPQPWYCR